MWVKYLAVHDPSFVFGWQIRAHKRVASRKQRLHWRESLHPHSPLCLCSLSSPSQTAHLLSQINYRFSHNASASEILSAAGLCGATREADKMAESFYLRSSYHFEMPSGIPKNSSTTPSAEKAYSFKQVLLCWVRTPHPRMQGGYDISN